MTHPTDVDVLIVGGGPTGLSLACLLNQYGVNFKIIEKNKTITISSKFFAIQARTLELFEQLGIVERATGEGHPTEGLDLIVRGKLRTTLELAKYGKGLTKYPYSLILEQCKIEKLLWEKLQIGGEEVEWQKELIELQLQADSVTAVVRNVEKIEIIRSKYLVATDGALSAVRALLRLPLEDKSYENRFLLTDVAPQGNISWHHMTLCLSQQGFAGFFPMPGMERFRAIGTLPDKAPKNVDKELPFIKQKFEEQAQVLVSISDPPCVSTYKIRHRKLLHFKEQRCFFAGDASQYSSLAGDQGINTAIHDAFNLAWKLSWVLQGRAREDLLETYLEERLPIAQKLLHSTNRFFIFITSRNILLRWLRLYVAAPVLGFLIKSIAFRVFIFRMISQIGIHYRASKLSEQCFYSKAECKAGDRLCGEMLNGSFQAYVVGGQQAQREATQILQYYFEGKINIYTLDKKPDVYSVFQHFGIYRDGLILVRPDGYVSYCSEGFNSLALRNHLNRFFLRKNLPLGEFIY
ncbi:MAG: FAD-dependent monooxygenase [Pseudobdellovibrionaceae bacterium]